MCSIQPWGGDNGVGQILSYSLGTTEKIQEIFEECGGRKKIPICNLEEGVVMPRNLTKENNLNRKNT